MTDLPAVLADEVDRPPTAPERLGDWSPEVFEENGRALLAVIRAHFADIRETPVAAPVDAADLMRLLDTPVPSEGEDFGDILADTRDRVLPHLVQWNHPSFFGYFPTSSSFPGVLGETLTAAWNVNAMLWRTSPAASTLESVVLRWLAGMAGYPPEADGLLVTGASLANLYALTAARHTALTDVRSAGLAGGGTPRLYASDQAHTSIDRAAIVLGIGTDNLVRIPSDDSYRMRPDLLDAAIRVDVAAGARPVAVIATVGTTSVAASDPVDQIAEVCDRWGVWLHVDAAYGGFYGMCSGVDDGEDLSLGDSLVVNPQKTLFVPMDATTLFCRRRGALAETFRLVPEYLSSPPEQVAADYMDMSPQLGRGFRALKLWWVIRSFGRDGLARRLGHAVDLAESLRRRVDAHPDWRCVTHPRLPLVSVRYEPRLAAGRPYDPDALDTLNAAIVAAVNADGRVYISHSVVREGYIIRISIGNISTTGDDVDRLWDIVQDIAVRTTG